MFHYVSPIAPLVTPRRSWPLLGSPRACVAALAPLAARPCCSSLRIPLDPARRPSSSRRPIPWNDAGHADGLELVPTAEPVMATNRLGAHLSDRASSSSSPNGDGRSGPCLTREIHGCPVTERRPTRGTSDALSIVWTEIRTGSSASPVTAFVCMSASAERGPESSVPASQAFRTRARPLRAVREPHMLRGCLACRSLPGKPAPRCGKIARSMTDLVKSHPAPVRSVSSRAHDRPVARNLGRSRHRRSSCVDGCGRRCGDLATPPVPLSPLRPRKHGAGGLEHGPRQDPPHNGG